MRLAWLTDLHLDFLDDGQVDAFCDGVVAREPDAILLGGDVHQAPDLLPALEHLQDRFARPIHFVLGNHDFYRGGIQSVREDVRDLSARSRWLDYLTMRSEGRRVVSLTDRTGLIGHDGWADGRLGDYHRSLVELNDYYLIDELRGLGRSARLERLHALGDEAASSMGEALAEALELYERVLLLTHVPPFRQSAWHRGRTCDEDWLPHMSCGAVGEVLQSAMRRRPDRRLTVLCGHTHSPGRVEILPNLLVKTGGARYGRPAVQEFIVLDAHE